MVPPVPCTVVVVLERGVVVLVVVVDFGFSVVLGAVVGAPRGGNVVSGVDGVAGGGADEVGSGGRRRCSVSSSGVAV